MPALPTNALTHERRVDRGRWRRAAAAAAASIGVPSSVGDLRPGTSCGRSARSTSGRASRARRRSGGRPALREVRGIASSSAGSRDRPRSLVEGQASRRRRGPRERRARRRGRRVASASTKVGSIEPDRPSLDHALASNRLASVDIVGVVDVAVHLVARAGGHGGDGGPMVSAASATACAAASVTPGRSAGLDRRCRRERPTGRSAAADRPAGRAAAP